MYGLITVKAKEGDFQLDEFRIPENICLHQIIVKYIPYLLAKKILASDITFIYDKQEHVVIAGLCDRYFTTIDYEYTGDNSDLLRVCCEEFARYFIQCEFDLVTYKSRTNDFEKVI